MFLLPHPGAETDRTDAFRDFVRRRAEGEFLTPPLLLPDEQRRRYVRQTLREDHQFRLRHHPEGAQARFDKLAESPFTFFRGTALLYYRDYAGTDFHLPIVFSVGDVHPENFGVMPNEDGVPFFGINDFDEAAFAPFTYDLKRGATGFWLVAKERGFKKKQRKKITRAFVQGYLDGLMDFARNDQEKHHQWRLDNSPKMIRKLIEKAPDSRRGFLETWVDLAKGRFLATEELIPKTRRKANFQKAVDAYAKTSEIGKERLRDGFFEVKDVAIKKGSGTASLGLDRFFVLIAGPNEVPEDDVILEFKQARPSALTGLLPDHLLPASLRGDAAEATVRAQTVHVAGGDPFYGHTTLYKQRFLVRERSPFKAKVDLDALSPKAMKKYAHLCGLTLAQTHARSDEDTGLMGGQAERRILEHLQPALFADEIVRFAAAAARRVRRDYKFFKRDHQLGAFAFAQNET